MDTDHPAAVSLHIVCPSCGAKNRVPRERLGEAPDCGRCGTPLMQAQAVDLTPEVFDKFIAGTELDSKPWTPVS